jgi:hypothetical protein
MSSDVLDYNRIFHLCMICKLYLTLGFEGSLFRDFAPYVYDSWPTSE